MFFGTMNVMQKRCPFLMTILMTLNHSSTFSAGFPLATQPRRQKCSLFRNFCQTGIAEIVDSQLPSRRPSISTKTTVQAIVSRIILVQCSSLCSRDYSPSSMVLESYANDVDLPMIFSSPLSKNYDCALMKTIELCLRISMKP